MRDDRLIVTVGTGEHFGRNVDRLIGTLRQGGYRGAIKAFCQFPDGSPSQADNPYAFKCYAIGEVYSPVVLWLDSSIVPLAPLEPIWKLIESQGYWLSRNYEYTNGEFTCDAALPILGVTREESFSIPHAVAGAFGLDFSHQVAGEFFAQWEDLMLAGAFRGPHGNGSGEASSDPRVRGHRHDQTAASVVAHRLGMTLTEPPKYFAEQGSPTSAETILTVLR